ncbi:MAG: SGNH/GDSL hydrolase family protein [Muribaculaceae bacterium]|nr:SGNH/GDSL hydrolase family protein [Muribaculaceae bacterium]
MKKAIIGAMTLLFSVAGAVYGADRAKPIVSILGDSYSTFERHIPEGNLTWYRLSPDRNVTDVDDVRQTWWWQLISEGGYILGVNDSYSGATVSYTGYDGADYSDRSFITRLERIVPSDVLLIFGATNDSWAGSPMGEYKYEGITHDDLRNFRPAVAFLVKEAQDRFPGTRIVFIINSELKEGITSSIIEVCRHYSCEYVLLEDVEKMSGHPSVSGMAAIKNQVLRCLKK